MATRRVQASQIDWNRDVDWNGLNRLFNRAALNQPRTLSNYIRNRNLMRRSPFAMEARTAAANSRWDARNGLVNPNNGDRTTRDSSLINYPLTNIKQVAGSIGETMSPSTRTKMKAFYTRQNRKAMGQSVG